MVVEGEEENSAYRWERMTSEIELSAFVLPWSIDPHVQVVLGYHLGYYSQVFCSLIRPVLQSLDLGPSVDSISVSHWL